MTSRRHLVLGTGAWIGAAGWAFTTRTHAAGPWPSRPLRLLVGFPGGSTPDLAARALAEPLARVLGQPVVVENRPGASGNIAATQVAQADDDHTLGVVINGNLTTVSMLFDKPPYDPVRDLAPLSLLTTAPLVLAAPATLPGGAAFFAEARRQGDAWNYGSVGKGSVAHLGMELLKARMPGLKPVHVPFQGNPPVLTAMLGGQIQMALVPPGLVLPHVAAGKLQAIGLSSGRSALAPQVPSLADAGVRDFELEVWTALVGPARLTPAARERLAAEVPTIVRGDATRQRLFNAGWSAVGSSPEGARQRIADEAAIMRRLIQATGTTAG